MGLRPLVLPISSQLLFFGHQLDAAVLSATLSRVVGGDEVGLAVTVDPQLGYVDSALHQVIGHGVRTALRQPLIVIHAADRVAVAIYVDDDVRIRLQSGNGFIQNGRITRPDIVLVEVEMHSA